MSRSSPLRRLATSHFDEHYRRKQNETFLNQPEDTIWVSRHRTLKIQYLHLGVFLWKQYTILAGYKDFCKLQSFCLCTPLLILTEPFFSGTYLLKLSSLLPFVTRWSVSVVIVFLFLGAGFPDIPPTFLISCEVQTRYSKILKYSEQYIRDYLSGTKVRIWIGSEYDAVFNFSCIASCNLTKSFTFSFISFLS